MRLRRSRLKDVVTVTTFLGEGGLEATFAEPVTVRCDVDGWRRLVRSSGGEEVLSSQTLRLHPQTQDVGNTRLLDPLELFTPESRVEVRGRVSEVVSVMPHSDRGRLVMVEVATT